MIGRRSLWAVAVVLLVAAAGAAHADRAKVGGAFSLTDHTGRAVTEKSFRGAFMLVYFGYTACPDVCPLGLGVMAEAIDLLGPSGKRVRPVFITLDPERDTKAILAEYVEAFHPRLVGLTGTREQIDQTVRAFHVRYAVYHDVTTGTAQFDHTSYVYLMGPDGAFLTHFLVGTSAERMAETLSRYIDAAPEVTAHKGETDHAAQ